MYFNVRPLVVLDGLTTMSTCYLIFPGTTTSSNLGRVYKLIKGAPHRSMNYPIQREPRDIFSLLHLRIKRSQTDIARNTRLFYKL